MSTESTYTVTRNGSHLYAIARVWSSQIDGSLSFDVRIIRGSLPAADRETVRGLCESTHNCLPALGCSAGPLKVELRARYGFEYAGFKNGERIASGF